LKKFKIIINPAAGGGRGKQYIEKVKNFFTEEGITFDISVTRRPLHATEIAKDAASNDYGGIVSVGGDGTINEIVNGVYKYKVNLGIIPIGSGNDFIKCIDIPKDFVKAIKTIIKGKTRKIDLGKLENRVFPNVLGIGFDALVADLANKTKLVKGSLKYFISVFKAYFKYKIPELVIHTEDRIVRKKVFFTAVGNGVCVGGKFYLTPEAIVDDGLLDICIVEPISFRKMCSLIPKVFKGEHLNEKEVTYFRARKLEITSDIGSPVHMDGEVLSLNLKKFDITVLPKALNVYVP